ncbi:hypothetical protein AZE42_06215 [Rhizopogon vesiculosus]|uniref:CCL2-like lectin domain-containing protein n=1 Tax=Rhizopogon vesiculosus TaxID=180088 RepID=A0A1J8QY62_9AGAM|nr:hypothetical protein AZE42_06215 [Rhizopogon vesiculosus]
MTSFALPLRSAPGGFFLFFFLLNCLLSVGALSYGRQESDVLLPAGVYAIINRVLSPEDERLAITFNGEDETVTVTDWTNDTTQQWVIADYDTTTQSVSPGSDQSLQAAWGDDVVTVLTAGSYVWTIRNNDTGYT